MAKQETETKSDGTEKRVQAPAKRKGNRKDLPSVAHLLAHGDPATAHLPKTWKEIIGFPLVLALVFFVSLLTFHYAPHSKSTHRGFKLPQKGGPISDPVTIEKVVPPGEGAVDPEAKEREL